MIKKNMYSSFKKIICYVTFFSFTVFFWGAGAAAQSSDFGSGFVEITTADKRNHKFTVEIASNDLQRAKGLMFRQQMNDMRGMYFIYDKPRAVRMWMKNTFISLDILFIDEEGKILNIARDTTPQSEKVIPSSGAAKYVLELNAGLTNYFNIKAGDYLKFQETH
jgi:uncharacterized membrane protein (UPF0127 family)